MSHSGLADHCRRRGRFVRRERVAVGSASLAIGIAHVHLDKVIYVTGISCLMPHSRRTLSVLHQSVWKLVDWHMGIVT